MVPEGVSDRQCDIWEPLLSIAQMPPGVPVATVAINGAKNAGILAAQILGIKYPAIAQKVKDYKLKIAYEVEEKAIKVEKIGYESYLNENRP